MSLFSTVFSSNSDKYGGTPLISRKFFPLATFFAFDGTQQLKKSPPGIGEAFPCRSVEPDVDVEQAVQGLGPLGQLRQVAFLQCLGEGVEERPDVAFLEDLVLRFPPLLEHGGHQAVAAHAHIGCPDDEVMRVLVPEFRFLVGLDASILVMPFGHQLADGTLGEHGQIAVNEPGVLPGEFRLAAEAQVVADKHAGPRDDARREGLVVAVTQAQHPAVVLTGLLTVDLHQSEVALTVVAEAVRLVANAQVRGGERAPDGADQLIVGDRLPGEGRRWGSDGRDFAVINGLCPAVPQSPLHHRPTTA